MFGPWGVFLLRCSEGSRSSPGTTVKSPITVDINQLNLVLDVLGSPTEEEIDSFPNTQTRNFLRSLEKKQPKPLESLFKNASPDAIDLLSKLLKFDQNKRITVEDALAHPYLKDLHYPADEPTGVPVTMFDFDFEKFSLTTRELKELIYEEVELYHSEKKRQEYERSKKEHPQGILAPKGIGKLKIPKEKVEVPVVEKEKNKEVCEVKEGSESDTD
eukprot:TRINITY_DN1701_c0_g1_i5.p1 TRINITY_DN1701_c0_g1~~TRINITY_DN1701_c0_g1_i5.p1  ORF type:complete len:216 (-),score=70.05 TRINITY_DN1701_c0_g1_i5:172-819(-)